MSVDVIIDDDLLTTARAASLLGMSQSHLLRLSHDGRIASLPIDSERFIPTGEVVRVLRSRTAATVAARAAVANANERRQSRITRRADQLTL